MRAQLQNKQDWARLWGYEVHQMAELVDGHMRPGPWQKVGLLRKVRAPLLIWHRCCSHHAAALGFLCRSLMVLTQWHHAHCNEGPMQGSRLRIPKQALESVPRSRAERVLWLDVDMVLEGITFVWLHVPKQALNSVPRARAEWLLWLDTDMVPEDSCKLHGCMCQNRR